MSENSNSAETALKENVRYLGRILGEVIKDNEGQATFDAIEAIRQEAIKYHRGGNQESAVALDQMLKN